MDTVSTRFSSANSTNKVIPSHWQMVTVCSVGVALDTDFKKQHYFIYH